MEKTLPIESVMNIVRPPMGASGYLKRYFGVRKMSATQAAKVMGVSQPTVTRFINGGALTPHLAAKIETAFDISIETLFNLEAQVQVYKATQLKCA